MWNISHRTLKSMNRRPSLCQRHLEELFSNLKQVWLDRWEGVALMQKQTAFAHRWPHAAQINATHWKWPYMGIYWYYVSHTGCHKFPTDNLLIRSCPNCLFCGVTDMTVFSERVHLQFDCTIPHTCACGTGFFWNNLSQSSYFWV